MDIKECYQRLEIHFSATDFEIRQAYKQLVKNWHPDKFEADSILKTYAEERLKIINSAYDQICKHRALIAKEQPLLNQIPAEPPPTKNDKNNILNFKDFFSEYFHSFKRFLNIMLASPFRNDPSQNCQASGPSRRRKPFQSVLRELNEENSLFENSRKRKKQIRKAGYNINMILRLRQRYGPRRRGGGAVSGITSTESIQNVKWMGEVSPAKRVK